MPHSLAVGTINQASPAVPFTNGVKKPSPVENQPQIIAKAPAVLNGTVASTTKEFSLIQLLAAAAPASAPAVPQPVTTAPIPRASGSKEPHTQKSSTTTGSRRERDSHSGTNNNTRRAPSAAITGAGAGSVGKKPPHKKTDTSAAIHLLEKMSSANSKIQVSTPHHSGAALASTVLSEEPPSVVALPAHEPEDVAPIGTAATSSIAPATAAATIVAVAVAPTSTEPSVGDVITKGAENREKEEEEEEEEEQVP